jgi:hypothetical protein
MIVDARVDPVQQREGPDADEEDEKHDGHARIVGTAID